MAYTKINVDVVLASSTHCDRAKNMLTDAKSNIDRTSNNVDWQIKQRANIAGRISSVSNNIRDVYNRVNDIQRVCNNSANSYKDVDFKLTQKASALNVSNVGKFTTTSMAVAAFDDIKKSIKKSKKASSEKTNKLKELKKNENKMISQGLLGLVEDVFSIGTHILKAPATITATGGLGTIVVVNDLINDAFAVGNDLKSVLGGGLSKLLKNPTDKQFVQQDTGVDCYEIETAAQQFDASFGWDFGTNVISSVQNGIEFIDVFSSLADYHEYSEIFSSGSTGDKVEFFLELTGFSKAEDFSDIWKNIEQIYGYGKSVVTGEGFVEELIDNSHLGKTAKDIYDFAQDYSDCILNWAKVK